MRFSTDIRHLIDASTSIYASFYGERKSAELGFDADWETGVTAGTTLKFNGPVRNAAGPWSLDLSAGAIGRVFDAADPTISSDPRSDVEAFAQAALTVPVAPSWSAIGTLGYRKVWSTYDIDSYDNISTSLAMMKSF